MASKTAWSPEALKRSLKIKASAVKRLVKDKAVYMTELKEQQQRIENMRAQQGVHEADIRKQNEVLEETLQMIPHIERRIKDSTKDLENLLLTVKVELGSSQEFADAKAAIQEAKNALPEDTTAAEAEDDAATADVVA
ncbi:hypothetical protein J3B02_000927 [Coemansia erecta]|uniref:Tubulin-specific chaperone A n=1 Tax=Coemansia asiatica TaxID=1052880 RepID=A0A9W7XGQ5_9FUNG|nr:hypothetical protein LPJ64_004108 [Coemansia asiatica]KAJ2857537.1 hypothetical protein J3B02_000927 [Coemansia erecta]KAJ2887592.1 hypothetical protein FB639_001197 [Coemansia asiatica]